MEEANKLIGTGKKQLVMGKVVEAVSSLQAACGLLAKTYGDTADECGEAFYWCGKALLDLARMENTVLGNALEGVPEEEEEEGEEEQPKDSNVDSTENIDEKTRDELQVQVYDAMAEKEGEGADKKAEEKQSGEEVNGTGVEKDKAEAAEEKKDTEEKPEAEEKKDGAEAEKVEEKTEKTETDTEAQKESGGDEDKASPDEEEEAEEEGEDDGDMEMEEEGDGEEQVDGAADKDSEDEEVGNLQLAWEILEVAKVIFTRTETKESQLMAAQTRLKLGEVSAESGNYTQALEDFQECLKLQEKHLEADSRLLAETHYQLGLTHSLNLQFELAIKALQSSISVIQSRLSKLQAVLDKAEGPEDAAEERKEMEELKALLPEIQEKVEDATEGLKTASSSAEAVKEVLDGGSTSSAFPGSPPQNGNASASSKTNGASSNGHASTASVSDISHLVRKKRKTESPVKDSPVKKVKQDPAEASGEQQPHANGSSKADGDADVVEAVAMQAER